MSKDFEISKGQWDRYIYCRDNGHTDFCEKAERCDEFIKGNQWNLDDIQALRNANRPYITINKVLSTINTILGEQIQNRVEVLFRPTAGSPAEVAEALTKVWMQIAQNNQLNWVRSDVFAQGVIRGRGFYDVRLDFNDAMEGEVRITKLNSKNVVLDPDSEEYDPDSWSDVFITKWVTLDDIEILYGKDKAEQLKGKENSSFLYGYDSVERFRDRFSGLKYDAEIYVDDESFRHMRRNIRVLERQHRRIDNQLHFVDIQTGDMRAVPTNWDRNRIADFLSKSNGMLSTVKKKVRRIRWTSTADDVVLLDEWSPYKHFTVVPYFPYFFDGAAVGVVENLIGPQEILNKVSSQELHVVNTTANSGYLVEENSLTNMTPQELEVRGASTGIVIEYKKGSQPPEKIKPNQVPTGLDRISMKTEDHIKSISGVSDSMQGFDREDVAAKAIAYKQQRGAINLTKLTDNLERSDWLMARHVLSIVQEYYTEPRLISIIKDTPERETEVIEVNQPDPVTGLIINDLTIGEYDFVVTSTPQRATLEDSQFEQARSMLEIGIPIPHTVLVENSRLQRRAEIIKEMQAAQQSPEAQKAQELDLRLKESEVAKNEATAQKVIAEVQLAELRAQKELIEAQSGNGADAQAAAEMERVRIDAELRRRQMELDAQLKREQMQAELQIKREQAQAEAQIKREQAERQAVADRVAAIRSGKARESENKPQKDL